MINTTSFNNDVKIELGIVPESVQLGDFKIEISVRAKDNSFGFVSYATKRELENLIDSADDILTELDRQEAERIFKRA